MINNIKLVSGFAHRDKSNVFSNVLVKDGVMTAQNEIAGISVDVDCDIDFCCNAERLNQALNNCSPDNLKMNIKNNRIYLSSGRFKSNIELIAVDNYPLIDNSGDSVPIQSDILDNLNSVIQFSDPNDIRVALQGVELSNGFIRATNGHMAIRKEIAPVEMDNIIIPTKAISMMMKANTLFQSILVKNKTVFFNFENGYLFSKTIDHKMPDIDRMLCDIKDNTDLNDISGTIKSIAPMCSDDGVVVLGKSIENKTGDASFDGFNLKDSAFNIGYLQKILEVANSIDFSPYPGPCPFVGDDLRGVVVGVKL